MATNEYKQMAPNWPKLAVGWFVPIDALEWKSGVKIRGNFRGKNLVEFPTNELASNSSERRKKINESVG